MHCVDLGESFQTHIYLQNFVSIQPRTSPVKFSRSPRIDPPGPTLGEASRLASKYHLELYEVKYILKLFVEADANRSGGLDKAEFEVVIRKLFDLPASADEHRVMVDKAWEKMNGGTNANSASAEANTEAFVEWYSQNIFYSLRWLLRQ